MKKIITICTGILLVGAIIFYFFWNSRTHLATIHQSVKQTGMIAAESGFILDEKDDVRISVKSSFKVGTALITLQNEDGEILYTFDTNCKQKETFSLEAGTYKFRIDSDKIKGSFDIVARKV